MTGMMRTTLAIGLACAVGLPAGVGAFTFLYAKGFSYMSSDPRACNNCHIMNEQYDDWMKSGHRHTATCAQCHLPAGPAKWLAKADRGFHHSVAFTLQNYAEPITAKPRDRVVVQANCVRCHGPLVHAVYDSPGPTGGPLDCLHCHAGAGH